MHAKTSNDAWIFSSLIFELRNMMELMRRMAWPWIFLNLNEVHATECRLMAQRHLTALIIWVVKDLEIVVQIGFIVILQYYNRAFWSHLTFILKSVTNARQNIRRPKNVQQLNFWDLMHAAIDTSDGVTTIISKQTDNSPILIPFYLLQRSFHLTTLFCLK